MNARVFLLVGALLAPTAWSQEPSFDLKSESVRNIVRATAESQSVAVQESPPVKREPAPKTVVFVPPEKPPLVRDLPESRTPVAAPKLSPILAGLIDTVIPELLNVEPDPAYDFEYSKRRACQERNKDRTSTQRDEECSPGQRAQSAGDQPSIVRPQVR